jgi:alkylation response protein AidB-like acyl-CoA dehydrogenase
MGNYFQDNDDLRFQFRQIDWPKLVELAETGFPVEEQDTKPEEAAALFEEILTALGEFASEKVAPFSKELDEQSPKLLENGEVEEPARMASIMKGLQEMGAFGLGMPRRAGGMNAPILVGNILMEMLSRGDVAVMSHYGFHVGIGQALMLYSVEEGTTKVENGIIQASRFEKEIASMASGDEWGAMVLTEPGAGSDLAKVKAKAVLQDDGSWRISGEKIWITSGHGEHHIVLARSEPEETHPGLKGLSLFYVPAHKERDGKRVRNIQIGNVEHKMGQHSVVAATLYFEESYGELIGSRGHGFLGMLLLMNNARIAVGFESLGIMESAHRKSLTWANDRVTMGKPISQHELIADYLDEMDVMIRGLRAITFEAAMYEEMGTRVKSLLKTHPPKDEDERRRREKESRRYKRKARHLTPLIKYVGGEESVRFARMAMQIFGGMGYITETGIEKLLRDALVIPVYEGTSQIQSLMALKDNLQAIIRNPGRFFSELAGSRLDAVRARDPMDQKLARLRSHLASAKQTILTNIAASKLGDLKGKPVLEWKSAFMSDWDPARDFSFGLLHAERLTKLLAWEAMAARLVEQAHAVAETPDGDARRDIAERFLERFEPRARGVLIEIEAQSSVLGSLRKKKKNVTGA